MTQLLLPVQLGTYANDGTGDDLRTAFQRVNNSFSALSSAIGITGATNLGAGVGIYKDINSGTNSLELKSLTSTGNTVIITAPGTGSSALTVNLEAKTIVANDTNPSLGANLNLANNYIYGGDTQTTVYGYDQRISDNLLSLLLNTNNLNVDLGSFSAPTGVETNATGYSFDFGNSFIVTNNHVNFGYISTTDLIQDNQDHKLTLGGNLTTSGGSISLNVSANSVLTLPNSGTLLTSTSPSMSNPVITGTANATNIAVSGSITVGGLNLKSLAIAMSAALG